MIVSQFREQRWFAGRLDAGQDVVAGFRTVCRENRISFGWILASAVLEHVELTPLDTASAAEESLVVDGVVFCPAISGNVSVLADGEDIRLYASVRADLDSPRVERAGRIRSGEVRMCEFLMCVLDDVTLVRAAGEPYDPWVQVQNRDAALPAPPAMMQPIIRPPASFRPPDPDEADELILLEIKPGDYVDHPRFGQCRVVHAPQDDRLTVRLGSGKNVDLHTGVLRILPARQQGGRKVYPMELRKRT